MGRLNREAMAHVGVHSEPPVRRQSRSGRTVLASACLFHEIGFGGVGAHSGYSGRPRVMGHQLAFEPVNAWNASCAFTGS